MSQPSTPVVDQPGYVLGASYLSYLLNGDTDMKRVTEQIYSADELLAALIPQLHILARRIARDEGVSLQEIGDRMVGAAWMFARLGLPPL